jgi:hypothetical protein
MVIDNNKRRKNMAYVKFNERNISTEWVLSPQETEGWYEVPEEYDGHNFYKLVDGKVLPLLENELSENNFRRFKMSRQARIKECIRRILTQTDWLSQRHSEQLNLNIETSLTDVEYQSLIEYRSSLRSLSNQDLTLDNFELPEYPFEQRYPLQFVTELQSLYNLEPEAI